MLPKWRGMRHARHVSRFYLQYQTHKHAEDRGMQFFKALILQCFLACRPIERRKKRLSAFFSLPLHGGEVMAAKEKGSSVLPVSLTAIPKIAVRDCFSVQLAHTCNRLLRRFTFALEVDKEAAAVAGAHHVLNSGFP
jgi:hypothetical protein